MNSPTENRNVPASSELVSSQQKETKTKIKTTGTSTSKSTKNCLAEPLR